MCRHNILQLQQIGCSDMHLQPLQLSTECIHQSHLLYALFHTSHSTAQHSTAAVKCHLCASSCTERVTDRHCTLPQHAAKALPTKKEHTHNRQLCQQAHTARLHTTTVVLQAMSMGPDIAPSIGVGPLGSASGSQGFAMGLAVPGLTVPWGHAGYLWLATAASIAVHEVSTQAVMYCCHRSLS